jgi:hypothetical protein
MIGELMIDNGIVFAYLDGVHGKKWYSIGKAKDLQVTNIFGYVQGLVADFPLDSLYADSETGAVVIST